MAAPAKSKQGTPFRRTLLGRVADPWDIIVQLQAEVSALRADNLLLRQRMDNIEALGQSVSAATESDHIQEMVCSVLSSPNDATKKSVEAVVSTQFREVQEQARRSCNIRIGGLPEGWDSEVGPADGADTPAQYCAAIAKVLPAIDWKGVSIHSMKVIGDKHAVLNVASKEKRNLILKQSKVLKGTKIWISEDLTPLQLKHRPAELQKVRDARSKGLWAVLRDGVAFIREPRS